MILGHNEFLSIYVHKVLAFHEFTLTLLRLATKITYPLSVPFLSNSHNANILKTCQSIEIYKSPID